jgi:hypothetical protein
MNEYSIVFLFIIILAVVSYLITKTNLLKPVNSQKNNKSQQEGFLDYQDVKTKTLNWCNKMQKVGLLSGEQFDQCVSSFQDTTAGLVSSGIADSKSGMNVDYSIYNTRAKQLSGSITKSGSGDNTNTIMLITPTPDNQTLACKSDGSLYQVSNIDDPQINQKELYFTLEPINQTSFAILSPYGTFLSTDNTYNAGLNSKSIGPLSTWNIIKITNSSNNIANVSNVMIEANQFPGFFLVFDSTQNTLSILQGQSDSLIWSIASRPCIDNYPDS